MSNFEPQFRNKFSYLYSRTYNKSFVRKTFGRKMHTNSKNVSWKTCTWSLLCLAVLNWLKNVFLRNVRRGATQTVFAYEHYIGRTVVLLSPKNHIISSRVHMWELYSQNPIVLLALLSKVSDPFFRTLPMRKLCAQWIETGSLCRKASRELTLKRKHSAYVILA